LVLKGIKDDFLCMTNCKPLSCLNSRLKKLDLRRVRPPPRHWIKKKTFSHRLRKSSNPYLTHIQRHRNTRELKLTLDLCFDVRQTRRFFYNTHQVRTTRGHKFASKGVLMVADGIPPKCLNQHRKVELQNTYEIIN
jgi:hypothetical protein